MMSEKLKPCPFCGGEAEISRYGNSKMSTCYQCNWCGAAMETSEEYNHGERWNERFETTMQKTAPEMYEMLNEVSDGLLDAGGYGNCALAKRIEALLAKARGEQ